MPFQTLAPPAWALNSPRSQPEAILRYNIDDPGVLMGEVLVTAPDACVFTAGDDVIPTANPNYYLFAVVKRPTGGSQIVLTVNGQDYGSGPKNGTITIPAQSTYDAGFIASGGDGWGSILSVTCAGGIANDWVDLWAVPDVDQFTRWRYVTAWDLNSSHPQMAVPDGYDPARASIAARPEATLSITKTYIDWANALHQLRGRDVTLMLEVHPGGGGNVSEYIMMVNSYLSASMNAPDNGLVASTSEGGHRALIVYPPGT